MSQGVKVSSELIAAQTFDIDLLPNARVRITLHCKTAYEAAILFDELKIAADKGEVTLKFLVEKKSK